MLKDFNRKIMLRKMNKSRNKNSLDLIKVMYYNLKNK